MAHTVLVVDDNKRICDLLDEFLRGENFKVLCANNGTEALSILQSPEVDVAVVDLLLPGGISGEQVIERATAVGVPVIIMSGALTSDTRGRDLTHPRLAKPFKMMQLQSAIENILKDKPS